MMPSDSLLTELLARRTADRVAVEHRAAELVDQYMREHGLVLIRVGIERSTAVDIEDENLDTAIGNLPLSVIPWGGGNLDYYVSAFRLSEWLTVSHGPGCVESGQA